MPRKIDAPSGALLSIAPVVSVYGGATVLSTADIVTRRLIASDGLGTYIFTTPAAAAIIGALVNPQVGDIITVLLANADVTGSNFLSLAGGAGVTVGGGAGLAADSLSGAPVSRLFYFRLDNVTPASEAISVY